jgi:hypothetical protein
VVSPLTPRALYLAVAVAERCATGWPRRGRRCEAPARHRGEEAQRLTNPTTRSAWCAARGPRRPRQGDPAAAPQRGQATVRTAARGGCQRGRSGAATTRAAGCAWLCAAAGAPALGAMPGRSELPFVPTPPAFDCPGLGPLATSAGRCSSVTIRSSLVRSTRRRCPSPPSSASAPRPRAAPRPGRRPARAQRSPRASRPPRRSRRTR